MPGAPIHPLGPTDLTACLQLASSRDWAQETEKWRLLLATGQGYGVRDEHGRLVASVMLSRYDTSLAVIGMLLVHPSAARQGLGRRLMTYALEQARPATVSLYATEEGQPLYEQLGFHVADTIATYRGRWAAPPGEHSPSRVFTEHDLPRVAALDRIVFGADRRAFLAALLAQSDRARLLERGGEVVGYGLAWRNVDTVHLGPLVARGDEAAQVLIAELAAGRLRPLRLDVSAEHAALGAWLVGQGLARVDHTPHMVLGDRSLPGVRAHLYAISMQAAG